MRSTEARARPWLLGLRRLRPPRLWREEERFSSPSPPPVRPGTGVPGLSSGASVATSAVASFGLEPEPLLPRDRRRDAPPAGLVGVSPSVPAPSRVLGAGSSTVDAGRGISKSTARSRRRISSLNLPPSILDGARPAAPNLLRSELATPPAGSGQPARALPSKLR